MTAPTLLIVGGDDEIVLELNREAYDLLQCARQLDVIPGAVRRFPANLKVPHMGWNQVEHRGDLRLFDGIPSGAHFYFVHSYYPETTDDSLQVASCTYGLTFPAAVGRGPLFATQFHPEKSQRWGIRLLENFAGFVRERR